MVTRDDMLTHYSRLLKETNTVAYQQLQSRAKANPEGARAEAISAFWLLAYRHSIRPEHPSEGGPDFDCGVFQAEVTTLEAETITERSKLPDGVTGGVISYNHQAITNAIFSRVNGKNSQFGAQKPGLLIVGSEHLASMLVLEETQIRSLMTGTPKISISLVDGSQSLTSELQDSVFIRAGKTGVIESARRNISALLLMQVHQLECRIVGALHPNPHFSFPPELLPGVPFCRFKTWPIQNGKIDLDWTVNPPDVAKFPYETMLEAVMQRS